MRSRILSRGLFPLVASMVLFCLAPAAQAQVEVSGVDWETQGSTVRFHVRFHNTDTHASSGPVSGQMHAQPYGAFLPNELLIGEFEVPQLAADSFFDIFYDVALADLPPSADTRLPGSGGGGGGGAGANTPGVASAAETCPPPMFWNGNVDIFWNGPGGTGTVNYHFGQLQICPGAEPSYIHVILSCDDPAGIFWNFSPVCPGWTATLVNDAGFTPGGPAPNPLPSGIFDGWICISANGSVPDGATCSIDLNMTCAGQTSTINVQAEACIWEPSTPTQRRTWGEIKHNQ